MKTDIIQFSKSIAVVVAGIFVAGLVFKQFKDNQLIKDSVAGLN